MITLSASVSGYAFFAPMDQLAKERESWFSPQGIIAMMLFGAVIAVGATSMSKASRGTGFLFPPPAGGGGPVTSDIRLKREVHHVATLDSGMKLYTFKYLDSDVTYVGVMAQDLLVNPAWRAAVVTSPTGYYSVDYSALGFRLVTAEDWRDGVSMTRLSVLDSASDTPLRLQPAL